MSTYKIPNSLGQWRQLNLNDTAGELWSSSAIDLHTNPGKLKLARPFKQVATDTELGSDDIAAFVPLGTRVYAITDGNLFRASSPFTTWSDVSDSISAGSNRDMVVFMGQIVATTNADMDAFNGTATTTANWWTARGNPALDDSHPLTLEVLRIGSETLAVTNGNQVHAYTGGITSGAISSVTVDLGQSFVATCIKSAIRRVFIGTYSNSADQAYVYEWSGASTNYTQSYPVGAKAVLSMELIDDVPLIVTERGEIKIFENSGFRTVAQFPFASKPEFAFGVNTFFVQANNTARPIHPKGMRRSGNVVYIYANWQTTAGDPLDERTPAGLWALDLTTYSLTYLGSQTKEKLFETSSPLMVLNDSNGRLFLGGKTNSGANGIWIEDLDDASENYGYIVTSEITASSLKDVLRSLAVKAELGSGDELVVKYRTDRDLDYPIVISDATWTGINENTFTSTDTALSVVKTRFDDGFSDEIEVVAGQGAGRLAHITNVTYSNPTYTVTIDEQIGVNGQTSYIRFDNWQKVPAKIMTLVSGDLEKFGIDKPGTFSQVKVALNGKAGRPEVREFIIKTEPKEEI